MFCSDKEYYIDFESFIENFSPYSKQIIQFSSDFKYFFSIKTLILIYRYILIYKKIDKEILTINIIYI